MSLLGKKEFMRFSRRPSLKVLFIAPEAVPFSKAGGLGEVMSSLSRALRRTGVDVRLMIPRYAGIDPEKFHLKMEYEGLEVPTGSDKEDEPKTLLCNVRKFVPERNENGSPVVSYFLENEEYFEKRSNIYGYSDDAIRWAVLSRGTLEFFRKHSAWVPDVIVANDWQTGFLVTDLATIYKNDERLKSIATIFLIHNLFYQGMFDHRFVAELDYDDGQSPLPSFFDSRLLKINALRRGILHADVVCTVSPTYAQEIMTPQYGELLDSLLKERRARVYGIMNGLNYDDFNPDTDAYIAENYTADTLDNRSANKAELQRRFGLTVSRNSFLIGIVSRLIEQKGFELLFDTIEPLFKELDIQLAVQGSGDSKFMGFFKSLEEKFPGRVGTNLVFDPIMPRIVYGGADAILIPSKFEPSGLTQLEAMRYGAVPIARKTGGLADTVHDYNESSDSGNGFIFKEFDSMAMMIAIIRAYENFRHKPIWRGIQRRGMLKDFSWNRSAAEYTHLFNVALGFRRKTKEE